MSGLKDSPLKHAPWVRKVARHAGTMLLDQLEAGEMGTITYGKGAVLVEEKSHGKARVPLSDAPAARSSAGVLSCAGFPVLALACGREEDGDSGKRVL